MQHKFGRGTIAVSIGFLFAISLPQISEARLVRLSVETREAFVGGISWGNTGPYERLLGTAYMEVNPRDALNRSIVDLDKAPRNQRGNRGIGA